MYLVRSLERKDIRLFGLFHPLLEILLPDMRPGPSIHVRDLVLDRLPGYHRGGSAVLREDGLDALDEGIGVTLLEAAELEVVANDANGLHQRVRVVEDRLVIEADELALRVAIGAVDLDGL